MFHFFVPPKCGVARGQVYFHSNCRCLVLVWGLLRGQFGKSKRHHGGGVRFESCPRFQTARNRFSGMNSAWPSQKFAVVPALPWLFPGSGQLLFLLPGAAFGSPEVSSPSIIRKNADAPGELPTTGV